MKTRLIVLLALAAAAPAAAEIERVATTADGGISMRWWPRVEPPKGWKHDREHSVSYGINAMAPARASFGKAQTVMYAKAIYKPRERELTSVDALIERDRRKSLERNPKQEVAKGAPLTTADGKVLQSLTYAPKGSGNWERVAYGEEGDFYLIFAVSSRTKAGYQSAMPAYEKLVAGYKEKP
jgi:hypothetical protein